MKNFELRNGGNWELRMSNEASANSEVGKQNAKAEVRINGTGPPGIKRFKGAVDSGG
jgi:hypothetical protein